MRWNIVLELGLFPSEVSLHLGVDEVPIPRIARHESERSRTGRCKCPPTNDWFIEWVALIRFKSMILNIPRTLDIDLIVNQDNEKLQVGKELPHDAFHVVPRAEEKLAIDGKSFKVLKALPLCTISSITEIASWITPCADIIFAPHMWNVLAFLIPSLCL